MAELTSFERKLLRQLKEHLDDDSTDSEIREWLENNLDLSDIINELFEEEDGEAQKALKAQVKELVLKHIKNVDSLDELDDEFALTKYLPEDYLNDIISGLFKEDPEIKEKLMAEVKTLIKDFVAGNIDNDDLPDWDELSELFEFNDLIKKAIADDKIKKLISDKVKDLVEEQIENHDFDDDDLPHDFWSNAIPQQIENLCKDADSLCELNKLIRNGINGAIIELLTGRSSAIWQKLSENENLIQIMNQELSIILKDRKVLESLQENLKDKLLRNEDLTDNLLEVFFGKMAELFVQRLIGIR